MDPENCRIKLSHLSVQSVVDSCNDHDLDDEQDDEGIGEEERDIQKQSIKLVSNWMKRECSFEEFEEDPYVLDFETKAAQHCLKHPKSRLQAVREYYLKILHPSIRDMDHLGSTVQTTEVSDEEKIVLGDETGNESTDKAAHLNNHVSGNPIDHYSSEEYVANTSDKNSVLGPIFSAREPSLENAREDSNDIIVEEQSVMTTAQNTGKATHLSNQVAENGIDYYPSQDLCAENFDISAVLHSAVEWNIDKSDDVLIEVEKDQQEELPPVTKKEELPPVTKQEELPPVTKQEELSPVTKQEESLALVIDPSGSSESTQTMENTKPANEESDCTALPPVDSPLEKIIKCECDFSRELLDQLRELQKMLMNFNKSFQILLDSSSKRIDQQKA